MKPNIMQKPETKNTYNFINGQLKKCLPGYKMNSKGDCEGSKFGFEVIAICSLFILFLDIDECESSPCRKGHKCLNLKGRYQCIPSVHCKMGMELNTAGDGCIGMCFNKVAAIYNMNILCVFFVYFNMRVIFRCR